MIRHQIVDEDDLKADFQEYTEKVRELKGPIDLFVIRLSTSD